MSEENVRAVREFAQAFHARDIESMIRRTSPDCVIVALRSEIEGAFVGHDGVRRWVESLLEAMPDMRLTLERVTAIDEGHVLVLGRQTGTALTGGPTFDSPLAFLAEMEAGLFKRLTAFPSHAEAVEAAGLSD